MKKSIFSRIFGAIIFVSFIAILIVSGFNLSDQIGNYHQVLVTEKMNSLQLLREISHQEEGLREEVFDEIASDREVLFLWVADEEGKLIYSSNGEDKGKVIEDEFLNVRDSSRRDAIYRERKIEVVGVPIVDDEGERLTAIAGVGIPPASSFIISVTRRGLFVLLLAALMSVFLALGLTERIIKPLLELKKMIYHIRDGSMDKKVEIETGDEIEEIGKEFNEMVDELKRSHEELEEARQILEIKVRARTRELEELNESLEDKVSARTEEYQRKVEELEKFHKLTVGREKKMIELKEENKKLREEIEKLKNKND